MKLRSLIGILLIAIAPQLAYSQNDTASTKYVPVALETIKRINAENEICDSIRKEKDYYEHLYKLQKLSIVIYSKMDTVRQNREKNLFSIIRNQEMTIKQIKRKLWLNKLEQIWNKIEKPAIFITGFWIGYRYF